MTNKVKIAKYLSLGIAVTGFILSGGISQADAQRDPFRKPGYQITRTPGTPPMPGVSVGVPRPGGIATAGAVPLAPGVPSIEQRIDYFKRMREQAAATGATLPKVTSVLTLDEMAVTGIFRTPRGYAAMVEATPINLSYTIYPGEKFFDGQLVAVEENRLVFRKVTKSGKGKYVSSVENKPLRQYTTRAQIEGTAPVEVPKAAEAAVVVQPVESGKVNVKPVAVVSPLEEMNKQVKPEEADKKKSAKGAKKPVKLAKNNK